MQNGSILKRNSAAYTGRLRVLEVDRDLEAPLPLSRVISRSGTIPVLASGGASMLYRAYCSCGEAQSQVSQDR